MASKPTQRDLAQALLDMDALVKRGGTVLGQRASGAWVQVTVTEPGHDPRIGLGPDLTSAYKTAVSPD